MFPISTQQASFEVGCGIYRRYLPESKDLPQVSFVAHLAGVFAGLTVGLVILRNYEQRLVQCRSWWAAISLLGLLAFAAFLYHCLRKNEAFKIFCTENCS
jgi:rhomboid-related protein 1/2/3